MKKIHIGKLLTVFAISVICGILFIGSAIAAEFSAGIKQTIVSGTRKINIDGKVYVKGIMQRQELNTPMGKQIVIVRPDKGAVWMIIDSQKAYMQQSIPKEAVSVKPSVAAMLKKMPNAKKIGVTKISNYPCNKYKFSDKAKNISGVVCISPKLQQELKSDVTTKQGKMIIELSNIKEAKQSSKLFDLPKGYKKIEMPKGNSPQKQNP